MVGINGDSRLIGGNRVTVAHFSSTRRREGRALGMSDAPLHCGLLHHAHVAGTSGWRLQRPAAPQHVQAMVSLTLGIWTPRPITPHTVEKTPAHESAQSP